LARGPHTRKKKLLYGLLVEEGYLLRQWTGEIRKDKRRGKRNDSCTCLGGVPQQVVAFGIRRKKEREEKCCKENDPARGKGWGV